MKGMFFCLLFLRLLIEQSLSSRVVFISSQKQREFLSPPQEEGYEFPHPYNAKCETTVDSKSAT